MSMFAIVCWPGTSCLQKRNGSQDRQRNNPMGQKHLVLEAFDIRKTTKKDVMQKTFILRNE